MKKLLLCLSVLVAPLFAAMHASAESYSNGDELKPISLQDQHEKSISVTEHTKVVLFSRSMKGGDIIKDTLTPLAGDKFPQHLVYIADISGMPSLIAKFVALPQMKELPFAVALDREGVATQSLPATKDMATLISLDNFKIHSIAYFDSVEALSQALTQSSSLSE